MNLLALQDFISVAEKHSAEESYLSQRGINERIASLETDLSSRLFERSSQTVQLTEAGEALLPSANWINDEVQAVKDTLNQMAQDAQRSLTIGVSDYVELERMGTIINTYKKAYPEVEVNLHFADVEEVIQEIILGTLDFGICSATGTTTFKGIGDHICSKVLWTEDVKVVVHKQHDLAVLKRVSLKELCEYPSILPKGDIPLRKTINNAMSQHPKFTIIETSDMTTIERLVECGIGWSLLPSTEISEVLVGLALEDPSFVHSVSLLSSSNRKKSNNAQAFTNLVGSSMKDLQSQNPDEASIGPELHEVHSSIV